EASAVQPVAGLLVVIDVDGEDGIVPAGRLTRTFRLGAADDAARFEIGVEVFRVVRELVLEKIDVGMLDVARLVAAALVVGVVLVMRRVLVSGYLGPIGKLAVDLDLSRRLAPGPLGPS